MREISFKERETAIGKLEYTLLEQEIAPGLAVYGVAVKGASGTASLPSVTASQREALELAELLAEGSALPTELPYLVEDWLARI